MEFQMRKVGTAMEKDSSDDVLFPSITVCAYDYPLKGWNAKTLVPPPRRLPRKGPILGMRIRISEKGQVVFG